MTRRSLTIALVLSCLLASAAKSLAADPDQAAPAVTPAKYIRIERDKAGEPLALQTAIVHLVSSDPAEPDLAVDLIGAVHVGERAYYEALNKQFENYDIVLYELVAPSGTRVPKGAKPSNHPVAMLQNGLKDMLQLEHQLQYVDYTKDNMVHADMSPDEFAKSMTDRGESFFTMFFRMMGQAMAQQSQPKTKSNVSDFSLLAAFFDKDRAGTLKRVMAEQFENLDGMMGALEGPGGSTIITERNKVAIKKLAEQIAGGKKKIAIFYGAGHLGDMEKHLAADYHLRRSGDQWLTAWKLEKAPAEAKPPAKKTSARRIPHRMQSAGLSLRPHLLMAC